MKIPVPDYVMYGSDNSDIQSEVLSKIEIIRQLGSEFQKKLEQSATYTGEVFLSYGYIAGANGESFSESDVKQGF